MQSCRTQVARQPRQPKYTWSRINIICTTYHVLSCDRDYIVSDTQREIRVNSEHVVPTSDVVNIIHRKHIILL